MLVLAGQLAHASGRAAAEAGLCHRTHTAPQAQSWWPTGTSHAGTASAITTQASSLPVGSGLSWHRPVVNSATNGVHFRVASRWPFPPLEIVISPTDCGHMGFRNWALGADKRVRAVFFWCGAVWLVLALWWLWWGGFVLAGAPCGGPLLRTVLRHDQR